MLHINDDVILYFINNKTLLNKVQFNFFKLNRFLLLNKEIFGTMHTLNLIV